MRTIPGCDRSTDCRSRRKPARRSKRCLTWASIRPRCARWSPTITTRSPASIRLLGDLLAALEKSGKADNTLVIYLGDHGADMLRGKRTCYEGGLRIPLIIRWPGHAKPQVREELVSTIDLMPTVLAARGPPPCRTCRERRCNRSLPTNPREWRTHLFAEYHTHAAAPNYHPQRSVRTDRFKLIENLPAGQVHPDYPTRFASSKATPRPRRTRFDLPAPSPPPQPEVRAAYAVMEQPPRYELYDLQNDPHEFHNLAADPARAATLTELHTQLTPGVETDHGPAP